MQVTFQALFFQKVLPRQVEMHIAFYIVAVGSEKISQDLISMKVKFDFFLPPGFRIDGLQQSLSVI